MVLGEEQRRLGAVQRHDMLVGAPRRPPAVGPDTSVSEGGAGAGTGARTGVTEEKVEGKEKGSDESG